jgi:hypothetical protein
MQRIANKYVLVLLMVSIALSFLHITMVKASSLLSTRLPARFSADGYGSTGYLVGQADLMLPLKGDSWHNFYIDPALAYGNDSQGYADLGLGYRWVKNSAAIFGGYLFGGYSRIDNNARLWVVNPGIEALGSRWDAHLNGYLVMGDRNKSVANFLTFDEFSGHSEFFNLFDVTQHAGDGVDVKLAYQLFPRTPLKAYVGSYFFSPAETNNVLGGAVGLEYWVSQNVKVFANYTYDNLRRSVGALGLGVELGGTHVHRSDPSVEERITDPVERYLAELGHGSAIPSQKKTQLIGLVDPITNIAFFSPIGTPNNGGMGLTINNCTFANPCGPTDLTNQGTQTLETLLPNTMIFFEGGTYSALDVLGGTNPVTIRIGQSINSYPGTPPSTFEGGFILQGNNSLNNIILVPTASTATGAGVATLGDNYSITGSQLGSMSNPFAIGLFSASDSETSVNNSTIFATSVGIQNQNSSNSSNVILDASSVNVAGGTNAAIGINSTSSGSLSLRNGSSVIVQGGDNSIGIRNTGNGDIDLSNSSVTLTGGNTPVGITSTGNGDIDLSNSTVTLTGGNISVGISSTGNGDIDLSNTTLTLTGGNTSAGIVANTGDLTLNNAKVNVTGGNTSLGITALGSGAVTMTGSQVTLTGGADSEGLSLGGSGPVTVNGGSTITVNTPGQAGTGLATSTGSSSNVTLDNAKVNVIGGTNSRGVEAFGTGTVNLINSSLVNVTGTGTLIGIEAANTRVVTGSNINVIVATDNIDEAIGLVTHDTATITLNGININVSGNPSSSISNAGGGPIMLTGSNVCVLNGNPVAC